MLETNKVNGIQDQMSSSGRSTDVDVDIRCAY